MKKVFSLILGFVMLLFVFSACSNGHGDNIVIWAGAYWGGDNTAYLNQMVEGWNQTASQRGKKKIKVLIQQEMATAVSAGNISGNIADIVLWDRWETVRYAKQNFFAPLTSRLNSAGIDTNNIGEVFIDEPMSEFYYESDYYGVPLDMDVWGFFVNRTIYLNWAKTVTDDSILAWLVNSNSTETSTNATVGQEGSYYNYPKTWESLYQASYGTTQKDSQGNILRAGVSADLESNFNSWIHSAGGGLLSEDGKSVLLTETQNIPSGGKTYRDATRELLSYWDRLLGNEDKSTAVTSYAFFSNTGTLDPFLNNKVVFKSNSLLNGVATYNKYKSDSFEFDFIPNPMGPDAGGINPGTYSGGLMGGYGFTIPVKAALKDEAWEVISWWVLNKDNYHKWCKISSLIPATHETLELVRQDAELLESSAPLRSALTGIESYKVRPPFANYRIYETNTQTPALRIYLERSGKVTQNTTQAHFELCMSKIKNDGDAALKM